MSIGTILLIVVILLLIGAIPAWPHSRGWGYGPSGGLGLVLVILLILFLLGKIYRTLVLNLVACVSWGHQWGRAGDTPVRSKTASASAPIGRPKK